jgi:hypothetical protein
MSYAQCKNFQAHLVHMILDCAHDSQEKGCGREEVPGSNVSLSMIMASIRHHLVGIYQIT